jgi:hypothetical protein
MPDAPVPTAGEKAGPDGQDRQDGRDKRDRKIR